MAVFLFSSGMSQNGLGLKTWAQFENLGELVKRGQRIFLVGKLSFKRIA